MRSRGVFAATMLAVTLTTAPALADATYPPVGPTATVTVTVAPTTEVLPEQIVKPGKQMPFTGQDIALMALAGGGVVVVGAGLVVAGRRRRAGGAHR